MKIRVGYGYDVHQLVKNRSLVIGGIKISHAKGALGHSDADVLTHAICDALLGAANLRDIGFQFPDDDAKYKNIDSKILLSQTITLLKEKKYSIGNIDCTICLQKPKVSPHIPLMKKTLCATMMIPQNDLSIKATTTEKLGFIGKEKGISAHAVGLIYQD